MTYESCRFLFHQFIQRDKPKQIVADLNNCIWIIIRKEAPNVNREEVDRAALLHFRPKHKALVFVYHTVLELCAISFYHFELEHEA